MLENISSSYVFQVIFSYLEVKKQLLLIKYNKNLQNKNNINLNNYKKLIGKCITYGENGKAKIYNIETDKLIFEGSIIKGVKTGKGREYDYYGGLIFKGEYLNGEKKRGKEYYQNCNIKFEGEYLNGKKWNGIGYNAKNEMVNKLKEGKGHIKEFDEENRLIFEGEYINGERNGKGVETIYYEENDFNSKYFEGQFINGKRNGKGKELNNLTRKESLIFEGEYLNGKRNGKGKEYNIYGTLKFEGEYTNNERNGKGIEYYYNNSELKFEGEFLNGKYWNGIFHENNTNNIYEIKEGNGILIEYNDYDVLLFKGEYLNGERNGLGKEYYECDKQPKLIFEGEYLNGKKWNGKGYNKKNEVVNILVEGKGYIKEYNFIYNYIIFEGEYSNGERNGKGKELNSHQVLFEGEYIDGKRNGKGKEYNRDSEIIFEGEYLNGKKNGKGKQYCIYHDTILKSVKVSIEYEGEYVNGKKNGRGKEYNEYNILIFDGYYVNDYRSKGKLYIKGKLEYEGEFLLRKKWNGKGYDKNGKIIYELKEGNGKVKEYEDDDLIYEGEYLNGEKNGKVKEYKYKRLVFEGEYLNGKKNGKVKEYHERTGNLIFRGEYLKGIKHGKSKEYDKNGKLIFNGEYIMGKKIPKKY